MMIIAAQGRFDFCMAPGECRNTATDGTTRVDGEILEVVAVR